MSIIASGGDVWRNLPVLSVPIILGLRTIVWCHCLDHSSSIIWLKSSTSAFSISVSPLSSGFVEPRPPKIRSTTVADKCEFTSSKQTPLSSCNLNIVTQEGLFIE